MLSFTNTFLIFSRRSKIRLQKQHTIPCTIPNIKHTVSMHRFSPKYFYLKNPMNFHCAQRKTARRSRNSKGYFSGQTDRNPRVQRYLTITYFLFQLCQLCVHGQIFCFHCSDFFPFFQMWMRERETKRERERERERERDISYMSYILCVCVCLWKV